MSGLDSNPNPNPFVDEAHLGKPINVGISGIQQVLRCVKDGTTEVRDLIFNECELLFECRACRNLFRQLPNFLFHKREFCKKHFCESMMAFTAEDVPEEVMVVQPESPKSNDNDNEMENVEGKTADKAPDMTEDILLSTSVPKIYQPNVKLTLLKKEEANCSSGQSSAAVFYENCLNSIETKSSMVPKKSLISLQTIQSNPNAMFQTVRDISRDETNEEFSATAATSLAEIRQQIEDAQTAVVIPEEIGISSRKRRHDSDGTGSVILRLKNRMDCSIDDLTCLTCRIRYQSAKTLDFHMRSVHSDTRIYYPCPFCNTSFVQIWSVMRHITTIHKKSKEQSYKMKSLIKSRGFRKNQAVNVVQQSGKPSTSSATQNEKTNSTNGHNVKKSCKNLLPGEAINLICKKQSLLKKSAEDASKGSSDEKSGKNSVIHICSKCGRSFARKSSQATHEKYCTHDNNDESAEEQNVQPTKEPQEPSERSNRPKRNAKKKQEADFVPLTAPTYSRANVSKQGPHNENSLLQKLNMTSATLEKKVLAIINIKKLRCLKCNRRFSTFSNLRRHAAIHIGWNRYKCKYCEYQSYNRSDCRSHSQRNHLQGKYSGSHLDKLVVDLPEDALPKSSKKETVKLNCLLPRMDAPPTVTVKLTKMDVSSPESLEGTNSFASDSSETESSQQRSPAASIQSSSNSSSPKKAKKSKEQCLYEGNDTGTMFSLKTRSGSYPKRDLLGKHLRNKSSDGKLSCDVTKSGDERPSTSNANIVPTSPARLKSSMTSKIQKFIYVHEDFVPQLKKSVSKPQARAFI